MRPHLFLTGPIGCGKSTAISQALGEKLPTLGGFLTRRYREPYLHFTLESPDGKQQETFLDFATGKPRLNISAFETLGIQLLQGDILLLDEIGGIELLCPEFLHALETLLDKQIPIIGVMKGEGPASKLIQALGLDEEYETAAAGLRAKLQHDEHTQLYTCTQFDAHALLLAENWVKEYCR